MPRSLLTTSVASASPSISSATITSGLLALLIASSSGTKFFALEIFSSNSKIKGFSNSQVCVSASVTKWGERNPRSNCMPSTTSTVVSACLPSSTVITPSLPTFRNASASTFPIVGSLLPAIVAICISSFLFFSLIGVAIDRIDLETASTALWMPRDRAIGSAPAAIILSPSRKMASASTVAVVVPSPATSLVLLAASLTS